MDKNSQIKEKLVGFGAKPNLPFHAKILSVENDNCTIKLENGFKISDVRLKATIGGDNYFLIIPKLNSDVIVLSQSGDKSGLMIIKVNEIDKIIIKQNGLEIKVDSSDKKVVIKNGNANVFTAFQILSDLLKQFQVYTSNGPSGTPLPNTVTSINQFETEFNGILKAN